MVPSAARRQADPAADAPRQRRTHFVDVDRHAVVDPLHGARADAEHRRSRATRVAPRSVIAQRDARGP